MKPRLRLAPVHLRRAARQANYTLAEAAVYLRRSQRTVRRLITRGLLRKDLTIRRIIIPGHDVENLTTAK